MRTLIVCSLLLLFSCASQGVRVSVTPRQQEHSRTFWLAAIGMALESQGITESECSLATRAHNQFIDSVKDIIEIPSVDCCSRSTPECRSAGSRHNILQLLNSYLASRNIGRFLLQPEIQFYLGKGSPIISLVKLNNNYHVQLIVGLKGDTIIYIDPCDGRTHRLPYAQYLEVMQWHGTIVLR